MTNDIWSFDSISLLLPPSPPWLHPTFPHSLFLENSKWQNSLWRHIKLYIKYYCGSAPHHARLCDMKNHHCLGFISVSRLPTRGTHLCSLATMHQIAPPPHCLVHIQLNTHFKVSVDICRL